MSRAKHIATSLAFVFVGVWALTIAFTAKIAALPFLLGYAVVFTCFAAGVAALVGALWFLILFADGEGA